MGRRKAMSNFLLLLIPGTVELIPPRFALVGGISKRRMPVLAVCMHPLCRAEGAGFSRWCGAIFADISGLSLLSFLFFRDGTFFARGLCVPWLSAVRGDLKAKVLRWRGRHTPKYRPVIFRSSFHV